MQLLANTNFDFLGKKLFFIGLSLVLSISGIISLIVKGGPRYGIDFRGGTLVQVKFLQAPPLDKIRAALQQRGLTGSTLQPYDRPETNQVLIGLQIAEERELDRDRKAILEALKTALGGDPNKLDFNNASATSLAELLRSSPALARSSATPEQLEKLAQVMLSFRDSPPRSGLIKNFDELASLPGVNPDIISALKNEVSLGPFSIRSVEIVGPKVGKDLQRQAILATLYALGGMLVYIAFRFEWIYGVAAVVAVFHDTIITVGFFSLFNKEISLTVLAALLTLVGYSMNDTIVIFDRIRENLKLMRRTELEPLINTSINQTLSRTILTSGLTFLTVLSLFLFGGEVLNGFSFALVVGIIVGTYSSVFVASPILIWWQGVADKRKAARGPVLVEKPANRRRVAGR
ncbi:MAG: protein translocase subunit SecF [Acidobacteria bacterium]|nr:protein translocase subunit SecF [Acidobacteriota bacterium]